VTGRTYADLCGIARALDQVGERWALLVIRELMLGPKRFTDLRGGLVPIGPDMLSQRLRELEEAGIVQRRKLAPPAASRVYELTDRGLELKPVLLALGRWGSGAPVPAPDAKLGADSAALALETLFEAHAAEGFEALVALRLGEDEFSIEISDRGLALTRAGAERADARISTDPPTLARVLWEGLALEEATEVGTLVVEGDAAVAERFVRLFPLSRDADD
jgi:DNA-binding HxlR family transcriptional regulator